MRGEYLRNSWDLVTAYYALNPNDERWIVSDECKIDFEDNACARVSDGKGSRYVSFSDERELERILNGIIDGTAEII